MSDKPKCECRNQDTPWHESGCPQGAAEELAQERGEEAEAATAELTAPTAVASGDWLGIRSTTNIKYDRN